MNKQNQQIVENSYNIYSPHKSIQILMLNNSYCPIFSYILDYVKRHHVKLITKPSNCEKFLYPPNMKTLNNKNYISSTAAIKSI